MGQPPTMLSRNDYNLEMKDEMMGETPRPEKFSVLYECGIDEKCSGRRFHRQELEKHVLESHMPKKPGLFEFDNWSTTLPWIVDRPFWPDSSHSRSEVLNDLERYLNYFTEIATPQGFSKAGIEKEVAEAREFGIQMNHDVWAEWEAKVQLALDSATVSPLFHIAKQAILKRLEENKDLQKTKTGFWQYDPKTTINTKVLHCDLGISPKVFNKLMDGFDG